MSTADTAGANTVNAVTAVGRAITTFSGSTAGERLEPSLALCCETFARSIWPDVAWRFSGLTTDGSPLEFTFSSADNLLRYTVDVAGPETQNHKRMAAACELAARLGHPLAEAEEMQRWTLMQKDHVLSWGARLGLREVRNQESIKIYLEVPPGAQHTVRSLIDLPLRDSIAVMIGYEPQSGATEYYFRQQQLSRPQLDCLLSTLADDEQRATMLAGIEHVCGMPLAAALQWTCLGYSIAIAAHRPSVRRLALFVRSSAVGGAVRVRQRMLNCMQSTKRCSPYCKLLADLSEAELPHHGVVSVSIVYPAQAEMRVGLSGVALSRLLRPRPSTAMETCRPS